MAENGAIVRARAINHIKKALHMSGFFPKVKKAEEERAVTAELKLNGVVDETFCKACEIFLQESDGSNVRRVINTFRSTKTSLFKDIPSGKVVTNEVRMATWMFIATHLAERDERQENNCQRVVISMAG